MNSNGSRVFFLTIFLVVVLFLNVGTSSAQASLFPRTLSLGMSGSDVIQLQKILNSDPSTQISNAGSGSPGQETAYFGALTESAVIRFQQKYASDILAPNGLTAGTGIVGPSTRSVLARISNGTAVSSRNTASSQSLLSTISTSSPNYVGLTRFISAVEKTAQKKGTSPQKLALIEKQIIHDVATTTDLRKTFLNLVQEPKVSVVIPVSVGRVIQAVESSILNIFDTKKAFAQSSGGSSDSSESPFGGQLYYSFYCSCSGNWLLTIQPLAPNYVTLLTYEEGTQAYLSYNLPEAQYLLGFYDEGAGQCQVYAGEDCVDIDADGEVSSTVGSSQN